jgi:predicted MFS family arabinose efflux permease
MAAEAAGLIVGGVASLRFAPKRPMRFVVLGGLTCAVTPLALATRMPLAVVCVAAALLGVAIEITMVQWTVALARNIRPEMLARVSSYDIIGSMLATPAGALAAGPVAAAIGVFPAEFGTAALTIAASLLALLPRDVRRHRGTPEPEPERRVPAGALPGP